MNHSNSLRASDCFSLISDLSYDSNDIYGPRTLTESKTKYFQNTHPDGMVSFHENEKRNQISSSITRHFWEGRKLLKSHCSFTKKDEIDPLHLNSNLPVQSTPSQIKFPIIEHRGTSLSCNAHLMDDDGVLVLENNLERNEISTFQENISKREHSLTKGYRNLLNQSSSSIHRIPMEVVTYQTCYQSSSAILEELIHRKRAISRITLNISTVKNIDDEGWDEKKRREFFSQLRKEKARSKILQEILYYIGKVSPFIKVSNSEKINMKRSPNGFMV